MLGEYFNDGRVSRVSDDRREKECQSLLSFHFSGQPRFVLTFIRLLALRPFVVLVLVLQVSLLLRFQGLLELSPGPVYARSLAPPPLVDVVEVGVVRAPVVELRIVEEGADAAEELGVDELARALEIKESN